MLKYNWYTFYEIYMWYINTYVSKFVIVNTAAPLHRKLQLAHARLG